MLNRRQTLALLVGTTAGAARSLRAQPALRSTLAADRLVACYSPWSLSITGPDPHPQRNGWATWIRQAVEPELNWGIRTILIHCPFGIELAPGTGNYQFDQAIHALENRIRA